MKQTATFTVTVKPSGGQTPPLTLTPSGGQLPDETVGQPVADLVTVISGGTPFPAPAAPYNYSITAGALPVDDTPTSGIFATDNADGTVSLTIEAPQGPTTAGAFSFDLTVVDSLGATATASVTGNQPKSKTKLQPKK